MHYTNRDDGMARRVTFAGALALLVAISLSGCDKPGETTPFGGNIPSSPASTHAGEQPSGGRAVGTSAPRVANPLKADAFIADPCKSLSEEQLQKFEVAKRGEPKKDQIGSACNWRFGGNGETFGGITYLTSMNEGLSRVYDQNSAKMLSYFEPTEIMSYPATYNATTNGRPQDCQISVGITDQLIFNAIAIEGRGQDACKAAKNIATAVVETIKAGQ